MTFHLASEYVTSGTMPQYDLQKLSPKYSLGYYGDLCIDDLYYEGHKGGIADVSKKYADRSVRNKSQESTGL